LNKIDSKVEQNMFAKFNLTFSMDHHHSFKNFVFGKKIIKLNTSKRAYNVDKTRNDKIILKFPALPCFIPVFTSFPWFFKYQIASLLMQQSSKNVSLNFPPKCFINLKGNQKFGLRRALANLL
jgi:hypothetical protein